MSKNTGTLVTSTITTYDSTDTYAVAKSNEIKGGHHVVANDLALSNISSERKDDGMLVTVLSSALNSNIRTTYQLSGSTWINFITGSNSYWNSSLTGIYYTSGDVNVSTLNINNNLNIGTGLTYNTNIVTLTQATNNVSTLVINSNYAGNVGNGHILLTNKTNNYDRMSIGFDSGSTFGYLQAYQNGGQKYDIQLNPLGGTTQIYEGKINTSLYFGNEFYIYSESTPANYFCISSNVYGLMFALSEDVGTLSADFLLTNNDSLKINSYIVYNAGNLNNLSTTFTANKIITNNGTAALPSYTFTSDTNTGIYRSAADQISISVGATESFRFTSGGTFHAKDLIVQSSGVFSDARLKKDINNLSNPLDIILKTNGVSYNLKSTNKVHFGYIAQDIEKIIPEIVTEHYIMGDDETLYKSIKYQEMIPFITEAIKEQQRIINNQQKEIYNNKEEISILKKEIENLKKLI